MNPVIGIHIDRFGGIVMRPHLLIFAVLIIIILLTTSILAGTTGKICGTIFNEETGDPVPGVAVMISGSKMGTLTNDDGEYYIINVPVGIHTIKASLIGFAPVEVSNVAVSVDLTTYNDFSLSKKALELGKVIVVKAERLLIIRDKTSSIRLINSEMIQYLPIRGYQEIVGLQSGVISFRDNPNSRQRGQREDTHTPQLNIRGGRNIEIAYLVDGFSQQDPLTGVATTTINNNALAELEITTGGFSAEYGWVSSGIVNVTTREGSRNFSGAIEVVTDKLLGHNYDYNVYSANAGGPIPGLNGSTFFLSGERRWQGDRRPSALLDSRTPHNSLSGWSGQSKFSLNLKANINLKIGGLYSVDRWKEYQHAYFFDIAHAPRYEDKNGSMYLKLIYTLSPRTFYTISTSYYSTERIRGDGVHFDDLEAYTRPTGNPRTDQTGLFWSWDDISGQTDMTTAYSMDTTYDTVFVYPQLRVDTVITTNAADRMYTYGDEGHVWDDFLHRKSSYIGFDFDISSQVTSRHLLKLGFSFQRHTLRYYRHLFPTIDSSLDIDRYGYDVDGVEQDDDLLGWQNKAKRPITWALYAQDKFEWRDLVVNAGLRFDYFDTRAMRVKDLSNPFGDNDTRLDIDDLEPSKPQTRLSPRIGIGYPVTDRTVVHMSYGLFFQRPELQYLYVGYDFYEYKVNKGGYFYAFGNPNLEPEKTTAYEFGISHQLGDHTMIDATAYYKDVHGLTQVAGFPANPKKYDLYFNNDFGTIKGLDLSFKMRRVRNISLDLNYSLSWANGTGSFATTQSNIAWVSSEVPVQTAPLDFDRRHKFTGIVDIRAGQREGLKLGSIYPLENAGINFVFNLLSGTPYTPMKLDADPVTLNNVAYTPAASVNSRYTGWTFRVDLKASKTFYIGGTSFDAYLWVLNLFDRDNVLSVYESSGDPGSTNWLNTENGEAFQETWNSAHDQSDLTGREKYLLKQRDPSNYDIPRQIRFGFRMSF